MLAQLLKQNAPAYKGLPTGTAGKVQYAETFYRDELINHFEQEEKMMDLLAGMTLELDEKIREIKAEHNILHTQFSDLAKQEDTIVAMDTLGHQLDKHIRKEERELFPLIEKTCDEKMLKTIEKILTS
jgi:hemerythrin-like domain-containing protein